MKRRHASSAFPLALALASSVWSPLVFAQAQPGGGAAGVPDQAGAGAQVPGGGGGQPNTTTTNQVVYPYGFAPPAPGQPVGGGNATESSARPVSGEQEDSFDL